MGRKLTAALGILGALLFIGASVVGGMLIEGYDVIAQYISESYAFGTTYGDPLRYYGFLPSGIALALFSMLAIRYMPRSKAITVGMIGVAISYGLGTIITAIFPCDPGCATDLTNASVSQLIHNLSGGLTYALMPAWILLVGSGLRKAEKRLSTMTFTLGVIALLFCWAVLGNLTSQYIGILQRMAEASILFWMIRIALFIRKA